MSGTIDLQDRDALRRYVSEKYGEAALDVLAGKGPACCGGNSGGGRTVAGISDKSTDAVTGGLYSSSEVGSIPEAAILASLGCGNPTALASLTAGETVLDLGAGGGIDVLLSARRVGPTGFVYGLDMTDAMLELAEQNRLASGAVNVKFLKGHIEEIPLPDNSVDVVISNCVINLSADKDSVFREAYRVLKPGGRFAVSDVVVEGEIPEQLRRDLETYVGCVAGALERTDYLNRLTAAGFWDASIEPTRRYTFADLDGTTCCSSAVASLSEAERSALDGRIMGAFIRGSKKVESTCCDTDVCCTGTQKAEEPCCEPSCCTEDNTLAEADTIQVFDPAMCCSTGVCGPSVDPELARFAGDLAWYRHRGVTVERFNLGQQPHAFISRAEILNEIRNDPNILPIVMVNGQIISRRTYPIRNEISEHLRTRPKSTMIPLTVTQKASS